MSRGIIRQGLLKKDESLTSSPRQTTRISRHTPPVNAGTHSSAQKRARAFALCSARAEATILKFPVWPRAQDKRQDLWSSSAMPKVCAASGRRRAVWPRGPNGT
ncbi:hypothetical protein [Desulfovibrio sp. MES5]|uniref:hypothetical protein n=1 Tax=Desulfovibrio sp. MES5 TaxID=1899016 RepID=UPI0025C541EF|nr:hypothetical protein [Desulfovibrio sp. MES5]